MRVTRSRAWAGSSSCAVPLGVSWGPQVLSGAENEENDGDPFEPLLPWSTFQPPNQNEKTPATSGCPGDTRLDERQPTGRKRTDLPHHLPPGPETPREADTSPALCPAPPRGTEVSHPRWLQVLRPRDAPRETGTKTLLTPVLVGTVSPHCHLHTPPLAAPLSASPWSPVSVSPCRALPGQGEGKDISFPVSGHAVPSVVPSLPSRPGSGQVVAQGGEPPEWSRVPATRLYAVPYYPRLKLPPGVWPLLPAGSPLGERPLGHLRGVPGTWRWPPCPSPTPLPHPHNSVSATPSPAPLLLSPLPTLTVKPSSHDTTSPSLSGSLQPRQALCHGPSFPLTLSACGS